MKRKQEKQLLFRVGDAADMDRYATTLASLQTRCVEFETERDGEWLSIWIG